jgi:murein DD-endopeptidase MepM/ murein hydrolase activator NlpD
MRTFARVVSFVIVAVLGWIGGSLYPAPPALIAQVSPQALAARARGDLQAIQSGQGMKWKALQSLLGRDEARRLADDAIRAAQQAGNVIQVEHVVDQATKEAELQVSVPSIAVPTPEPPAALEPVVQTLSAATKPAGAPTKPAPVAPAAQAPSAATKPGGAVTRPAPSSAQAGPVTPSPAGPVASASPPAAGVRLLRGPFEATVLLCPGMTISDAPPSDASRHIANFSMLVNVNGDVLAVDPIRDACLSSGFGTRGGRLHKGIDFYNPTGGAILAAGDGTILEMKYRDDYGNMILIDHGHGVYTRYAHLSSFHNGLALGAHVHAGDEIGLMGNTAAYPVPLHLHYEMLLGDYGNPKGSFGLTPHSPFEYRAAM